MVVLALEVALEVGQRGPEAADLEKVVGIALVEVVAVGIDLVEAVGIGLEAAVGIGLVAAVGTGPVGAADIALEVVAADIVLEEVVGIGLGVAVGIGLVLAGTAADAAGKVAPVPEAFDLAGPDQAGTAGIVAGRGTAVVVGAAFVVGKLAGVDKPGTAAELGEFDAVHRGWAGHEHQPVKGDICLILSSFFH